MRWILLFALCLPCWGGEILVEIEDSRLRAGDLAAVIGEVAQPSLDLGPAPAPGVRRRVKRAQLARWASAAEAQPEHLPDEILLVRKLRAWPRAEAAETLRRLLAEKTRGSVAVELSGFVEREIPAGDLEWSLLGAPRLSERPMRLSLSWRDPGGRTGLEALTASVRARVQALVARRDLDAGAELIPEDFELAEIDVRSLDNQYLEQIESNKRLKLKLPLMSGEALPAAAVDEQPELERGAVVELIAAVGAVRLRAPARAEGSGSAGDLVPFRNLETNQRILARVMDARTAEVVKR